MPKGMEVEEVEGLKPQKRVGPQFPSTSPKKPHAKPRRNQGFGSWDVLLRGGVSDLVALDEMGRKMRNFNM